MRGRLEDLDLREGAADDVVHLRVVLGLKWAAGPRVRRVGGRSAPVSHEQRTHRDAGHALADGGVG